MTELSPATTETPEPAVKEMVLYKFSNKAETPYLDSLFAMFHHGAFTNSIGIMEAWNLETEREETILVGVEIDPDGKPDCYPIAKVLRAEDIGNYLAPNGKGGYFDPQNPAEVAEFKENTRSLNEAVVDEPESAE